MQAQVQVPVREAQYRELPDMVDSLDMVEHLTVYLDMVANPDMAEHLAVQPDMDKEVDMVYIHLPNILHHQQEMVVTRV